ncbi:MAG TPA: fructose-bisphosphatase class III, partial [Spirochaetota bacterium]|nr:fructose-bisphosphatase class III [Spirochaetota bacterium]
EIGYGINLLPLVGLSMDFYKDFKSEKFKPKISPNEKISQKDIELMTKMHLAITIIQLKLEGQIIKKRKEFKMNDRLLLDKIDFDNYSINIEGVSYPLNTNFFPTVDKNNPYELNEEEKKSVEKLRSFFVKSEKLQKHINFLYSKGSLYLKYNSNLLFHGCIPMTNEGKFENVKIDDKEYSGKRLMDKFDKVTREAFFSIDPEVKTNSQDLVWYLWQGTNSPLFGKKKMTTFERYFIDDPETHKEQKNPFYNFRDDENTCKEILKDFDLPIEDSHIISGHIPVKVKLGESPIKANGKLFVIDGGFSKAYQKETGIAGYTLIYNSYGLQLVSHESFGSTQEAIENEKDILSLKTVLENSAKRKTIADTDVGKELTEQIEDLKKLVIAY